MDDESVGLSRDWKKEAAKAVANISYIVDLDNFAPLRFDAVELTMEGDTFQKGTAAFASTNRLFPWNLPGLTSLSPWRPP